MESHKRLVAWAAGVLVIVMTTVLLVSSVATQEPATGFPIIRTELPSGQSTLCVIDSVEITSDGKTILALSAVGDSTTSMTLEFTDIHMAMLAYARGISKQIER